MVIIKFCLGIIFLIYGFFKILVCSLELYPNKVPYKNSFMNYLAPVDRKRNVADLFVFIVILCFAFFTVMKGLIWIGIIHYHFGFEFYVLMNLILGVILVGFYTLVVYTNVPIPKDPGDKNKYKGVGIASGLLFLIMIPVLFIIRWFKENKHPAFASIEVLGTVTSFFAMIGLFLYILSSSGEFNNIRHATDLLMISLFSMIS